MLPKNQDWSWFSEFFKMLVVLDHLRKCLGWSYVPAPVALYVVYYINLNKFKNIFNLSNR
jgi:type III secretory pathway component EscR